MRDRRSVPRRGGGRGGPQRGPGSTSGTSPSSVCPARPTRAPRPRSPPSPARAPASAYDRASAACRCVRPPTASPTCSPSGPGPIRCSRRDTCTRPRPPAGARSGRSWKSFPGPLRHRRAESRYIVPSSCPPAGPPFTPGDQRPALVHEDLALSSTRILGGPVWSRCRIPLAASPLGSRTTLDPYQGARATRRRRASTEHSSRARRWKGRGVPSCLHTGGNRVTEMKVRMVKVAHAEQFQRPKQA